MAAETSWTGKGDRAGQPKVHTQTQRLREHFWHYAGQRAKQLVRGAESGICRSLCAKTVRVQMIGAGATERTEPVH